MKNRKKKTYEKNWISDEFEPHLTFSVLAYFQEKFGDLSDTLFTVGWTKTIENTSQQDTSNVVTEDFEEVFSRSFLWKEALSATVEYKDKGFLFRLRGNYALDNNFYNLAFENYFYLTSRVRLYFSGDLNFRFSDEALKKGSSSISQYKDLSPLSCWRAVCFLSHY